MLVIAALSFFCAASAAAAPPGFDLRFDQTGGARLVSVANARTGAFVAAAGGGSLDLLEGDAAQIALDRLNTLLDLDLGGDEANGERDASGKRKIIVHKMDYDEDQSGDSASPETRIITRQKNGGDGQYAFDLNDDSGEAGTVHLSAAPDACGADRRLIYINGADAAAAAKFIDKIAGLEPAERAAMKRAVGL